MFYVVSDNSHSIEYALDYPRKINFDNILFIQGWVAISNGEDAFLRVTGKTSKTYPLNQNRADVVNYLNSKGIFTVSPCGFSYSLEEVKSVELIYKTKANQEIILAGIYKASNKFDDLERKYDQPSYNFVAINDLKIDTKIKKLSELLLTHNYQASLEKIVSLVSSGDILNLQHPLYPDVNTHAVSNIRYSGCNFIFYRSDCGKHEWIMVQVENFIDAILFPDFALYVFSGTVIDQILNSFNKIYVEILKNNSHKENQVTSRFFLGHPRPFHFIYDQYFNYKYCVEKVKGKCIFYTDSYFIPDINSAYTNDTQNGVINYALNNVGLNFKIKHHGVMLNSYHESYERSLFELSGKESYCRDSSYGNLKIWIGITGQKRTWKEQVVGYISILNNLSSYFKKVEVLIDGWTAVNKAIANDIDDLLIVQAISDNLNANITVTNLVGLDYEEKIYHAHGCDCFISNAGSGSIVPLRIAKLDGALHSNPALITFPLGKSEPAYSKVKLFLNNGGNGLGMNADYSIDWRKIYNHIVSVLNSNKKTVLPTIDSTSYNDSEKVPNLNKKLDDFPITTLDQIIDLYDKKIYLKCYQACLWFLKSNAGDKVASRYLLNSRVHIEPCYSTYIRKCLNAGYFSKSIRGLIFDES